MTTRRFRRTHEGELEEVLMVVWEGVRIQRGKPHPDGPQESFEVVKVRGAAAEKEATRRVAALLAEGFQEVDVHAPVPSAKKEPPAAPKRPKRVPYEPVAIPGVLKKSLVELRARVGAAGLARHAAQIERLARPTIAFDVKKAKGPKGVVSRIGGEPDRPKSAWPDRDGVPLAFVAQLVLDDLDVGKELPKPGLLSLYAQLDPSAPEYGEVCALEHYPSTAKLVRTRLPKSVERIEVGLLTPKLRLAVPPSECSPIDDLDLDDPGAYHDQVFLASIPEGPNHLLLGWPTAGTTYGMTGQRFVMQIDSDDRLGFEMGDAETLRVFGDVNKAVCTMSEA